MVLVISVPAMAQEPELFKWRVADNAAWSRPDRGLHMAWGYWQLNQLDKILSLPWAIGINAIIAWSWEVKDGYIPYEKFPWLGGDGFDYKDGLMTSLGGALIYVASEYWIFKGDNYYLNLERRGEITQLSLVIGL